MSEDLILVLVLWYSNKSDLQCLHPKWVATHVPTALLPIQLCANVSGKAVEDGLSIWYHATQVGDSDDVPGFYQSHLCPMRPFGE